MKANLNALPFIFRNMGNIGKHFPIDSLQSVYPLIGYDFQFANYLMNY